MSHLVNLAKNGDKSLVIDASNLSVFTDIIQSDTQKRNISFHLTTYKPDNKPLYFEKEAWNLDARNCAQILAAAGYDFFEMPFIWGDGKYYGEAYINPDSVSAIIVSAASTPDDATEPQITALIDINGHGRHGSCLLTEKMADDFCSRIVTKRPYMERVDPTVAQSRFINPGYVLYDPKQVNCIYQNGYDVDVTFTDNHRIDFRLSGRTGYKDDPHLRDKFAASVAAKASGLVKLDSTNTYYTKLNDIVSVLRFDKQLQFIYEGRSKIGGDVAYFDSEQKAQSELERILALTAPKL